jgi:phosphoserine phosphatase
VSQQRILLTVSGPDQPGITARLTGLLAEAKVQLANIEQVVVAGHLTLCLVIDGDDGDGNRALKELLFATKEMGLALDFKALTPVAASDSASPRVGFAITVLGERVDAGCIHALTVALAAAHANIDEIRRLSDVDLSSLEIVISLAHHEDGPGLRKALMAVARAQNVDLALQRDGLWRRQKRLACFDMDSTLISIEVIDELARAHGVFEQVAAMTATAMAGGMPYEESLKRRVALLAGMKLADVHRVAGDPPLTEGAADLVTVLKGMGLKTAVISGGFSIAADALKRRLGLDFAYSNVLDVKEGVLTGLVIEPIVGPQRKADLLETIAQMERIPLAQTVAIGDGANDLLMLERAGLGIAFHAKPKLRDAAHTSISRGGLDRVLYMLGLSAHDVQTFVRGG